MSTWIDIDLKIMVFYNNEFLFLLQSNVLAENVRTNYARPWKGL